jgi:uncharacterized SAM-binding protein YcdF (DUF218 family)
VFVLAAGVASYAARSLWLPLIAEFLIDAGHPHKADMIVVLAGDFSGNRILKAAELVRDGFAPKALVSGPEGQYGRTEDELAIQFAVECGYPRSYFIALPNDGKSTTEEADRVIAALERMHIRSVEIVTSDIHTRRAGAAYRRRTAAAGIEMHVVAAPSARFKPGEWWKEREGQKAVFLEWTKTIATWFGI